MLTILLTFIWYVLKCWILIFFFLLDDQSDIFWSLKLALRSVLHSKVLTVLTLLVIDNPI
jgi:hypothetical protein